jgi:hypothetical protein
MKLLSFDVFKSAELMLGVIETAMNKRIIPAVKPFVNILLPPCQLMTLVFFKLLGNKELFFGWFYI